MGKNICIPRTAKAIAARREALVVCRGARGLAVVKNHINKTQQQRPRWRAGTLQVKTMSSEYVVGAPSTPQLLLKMMSSDYVVGAPPTPQLPVRTASPPLMCRRSPSPDPYGLPRLPCGSVNQWAHVPDGAVRQWGRVGGRLVPGSGYGTPPIPQMPDGHHFDFYGEKRWFVQVHNCRVEYKAQTREGKGVTQEDWIVRFPRKHGHKLLGCKSIYYSINRYGFEKALGWALRHKPARVDSKGKCTTDDVTKLTVKYLPEEEWPKVGL